MTAGALQWLTLAVAAVAALGAVLGPILVYRAAVRELGQQRWELVRNQRQERIDQAGD